MCDYCDTNYQENDLRGSDGIIYDKVTCKYYLFAEHFRNEKVKVEVKYCPQCGRKLG